MYYSNQTLVHKRTKRLVRLVPQLLETTFSYQGPIAEVVDDNGHIQIVILGDYTCVRDSFDRPVSGLGSRRSLPDMTLMKYVNTSEEEKQKERMKALEEVTGKIRQFALHCDRVKPQTMLCPFADGAPNWKLEDMFLELVNAKPLVFPPPKIMTFELDGIALLYLGHNIHLCIS